MLNIPAARIAVQVISVYETYTEHATAVNVARVTMNNSVFCPQ